MADGVTEGIAASEVVTTITDVQKATKCSCCCLWLTKCLKCFSKEDECCNSDDDDDGIVVKVIHQNINISCCGSETKATDEADVEVHDKEHYKRNELLKTNQCKNQPFTLQQHKKETSL